jgi:hypothetical protein
MAMHKTNSILKYVVPVILLIIIVSIFYPKSHENNNVVDPAKDTNEVNHKNLASHDSASESLNTLTAELSHTKDEISQVSKSNEELKKNNTELLNKLSFHESDEFSKLQTEISKLKNEIQLGNQPKDNDYPLKDANSALPLTLVADLSQGASSDKADLKNMLPDNALSSNEDKKDLPVPYFTIPANGTSVKDRLMTALVGRIPVKGIVTDPYPFKIVVSDDNLAANGLRIPHLQQMIVSGYCEGDLLLMGVRGWVTSLTFVFDDGTISTTTSNDNDIGNFTKSNSLGYLSDKFGNPYIPGLKFISNVGSYMAMKAVMSAGAGAANAYSLAQTTTESSPVGGASTTAVTGSQGKYVLGQSLSSVASGSQQWIDDRESQSFDAVYVAPTDGKGQYVEVEINFSKEIHIDYNPKGRKINYANSLKNNISNNVD